MKSFFQDRIFIKTGDITQENVDAVVNAANSSLMGGGGVDGAIHGVGGASILEECKKIRKESYPGGLPTGLAVLTGAGNLRAKYVIHTVGPIFGKNHQDDDTLLINAYKNSLKIAVEKKISSIAFPAISTGVYGFPKDRAAKLLGNFINSYLKDNLYPEKIIFVFFSNSDQELFLKHCGWKNK